MLMKTWVVEKAAVRSEAEYPTEITEINTQRLGYIEKWDF